MADIVNRCGKTSQHPARAAVAPPCAGYARTENAVETSGPVALEVAQKRTFSCLRRRVDDEMHVIGHHGNSEERPAAKLGSFLELCEQPLGLCQVKGDRRTLELCEGRFFEARHRRFVVLAKFIVFDPNGRFGVVGTPLADSGDATASVAGEPLAIEG